MFCQTFFVSIFMAALRSRCRRYIFALWFLLSFFLSLPNLSRRRLDVYHTSTHGVALVRTTLSGYILATKAHIDNRKKTC